MAKRFTVRVSDEIGQKIVEMSKEYGITQSQLGGMAIQAGLNAIVRAVKPEQALSPEIWAKIAHEMEKLKDVMLESKTS